MKFVNEMCSECDVGSSRRRFLREAGMALAALAALGISAEATELKLGRVTALLRAGSVVRYPVPSADGAQIDNQQEIILVRWQGSIYAFNLSCPHQRTAL
jgi:hypothetical protein